MRLFETKKKGYKLTPHLVTRLRCLTRARNCRYWNKKPRTAQQRRAGYEEDESQVGEPGREKGPEKSPHHHTHLLASYMPKTNLILPSSDAPVRRASPPHTTPEGTRPLSRTSKHEKHLSRCMRLPCSLSRGPRCVEQSFRSSRLLFLWIFCPWPREG